MEKDDLEKKTNGSEQDQKPEGSPQSEVTEPEASNLQGDELRKQADQYKDMLLRKVAEFDNYKRRTEAEWLGFQRFANERILLSFLPIADDLARSLKSGAEQKSFDAFYQGVELIHNKLLQTLKANGVEPMESVGKQFSVDEHDALLQIPRVDVPPHTIVEEVEKGYRLNDRVLRHAKVIVSGETDGTKGTDGGDHGKA